MTATAPLLDSDPQRVGAYTLTARLGEGGQGVVYLGTDARGGLAAVKLLHTDLLHDFALRAQLVKEVETARRVARFCTAQVLDADVTGDPPYVVSEFIDGPSLHAVIRDEGPLTGSRLERLAVGTITALAAIHRAGIVHRDFKPGNVLLGPDGPRVIDFGIARALDRSIHTDTIAGTPSYMAPEQVAGGTLGPEADVFAWGATIVFAATATPPHGQDSLPSVIHRVTTLPPDLGGLTGPLRALVEQCLAKDPAARPTAAAVLMSVLSGGTPPSPESPAEGTARPVPVPAELPTPTLQAGAMVAAGNRPPAVARRPEPSRPATAGPSTPFPPGAYAPVAHPATGGNGAPPGGPGTYPPGGPVAYPPRFAPLRSGPPTVPPAGQTNHPPSTGFARPRQAGAGRSSGVLLFLGILLLVGTVVAAGVAFYLSQQGGQSAPRSTLDPGMYGIGLAFSGRGGATG
ncbi:serine/threonine-protein kinase [Nocardiopsis ansamitocini]|uniref:Protein kinase domain-containing protein n=1 Tax=Nocardiopsis ansamitocini TaxID=1670832 RepID=A0A9W6P2X8_9ACTN|nr:serine/threonine-protein kinase [Nocardiopsis ansamitocini]GLU46260.1 hypothetical protein Nans01_06110 [Nocardiopsis ansamitocini]